MWKCLKCGEVLESKLELEMCPVCHTPKGEKPAKSPLEEEAEALDRQIIEAQKNRHSQIILISCIVASLPVIFLLWSYFVQMWVTSPEKEAAAAKNKAKAPARASSAARTSSVKSAHRK